MFGYVNYSYYLCIKSKHNNMQLSPKSVFKTRNPDGTVITTEEWDFSTIAGFSIAKYGLIIIMTVALASIVSPLLLLISVFISKGRGKVLNLIGVLGGCYFLIDAINGWLTTVALSFGMDENGLNIMLGITVASIISHIILLFFGEAIFTGGNIDKAMGRVVTILSVVCVFSFLVSTNVTSKHKGWLEQNIKYVPEASYEYKDEVTPEKTANDKELENRWSNCK